MDFVANGSKNVEIETSTGVYLRHAIQTHFVEIGEDYIELVNRYVKPLYEEGDLLSISEKIIALCQKRVVYRKDMKISWLAKFLSRFAIQHNSAGMWSRCPRMRVSFSGKWTSRMWISSRD